METLGLLFHFAKFTRGIMEGKYHVRLLFNFCLTYLKGENIMEHIVQFAIGIDDEAIQKRVIEGAYNDVVKQLMKEAKKEVGLEGSYYNHAANWERIIGAALRGYFDENKDMIIELAASKLVESFKRTKSFKEKMASAIEESKL